MNPCGDDGPMYMDDGFDPEGPTYGLQPIHPIWMDDGSQSIHPS